MRSHALAFASAFVFVWACSDNNLGTASSGDGGSSLVGDGGASGDGSNSGDGGVSGDGDGGQAANASQNGQVVDAVSAKGIVGASIDFGNGVTTTTDSSGNYLLPTKQSTPFNMVVTLADYTQLIDQEWELTGDFNAGSTRLTSSGLSNAVNGGLADYDSTKGVLGVAVEVTGACNDNAGAVVSLSDPSAGKIIYFKGTTPFPAGTSVQSGSITPSALIYNLDLATTAKVVVTPPSGCSVASFPFSQGTVTYTGNWKVQAGSGSTSFFRVFVQ